MRATAIGFIAAYLLAYLVERQVWSPRFWLLFAGIALVLGVIIRIIMKRWFNWLDANRREFDRRLESLTHEEAGSRAAELLADSGHYRTTTQTNSEVCLGLHPTLRKLFDRFEVITDTTGNRLSLGVRTAEFVEVGMLHDGVKLLARLRDGAIFEVWPDQSGPKVDPDFPSIQHWLVINSGE
jgi:hypothetical protein